MPNSVPYATAEQFILTIGQETTLELTNLEQAEAEDIDLEVLERALDDAQNLINSYLSGRYSLPLASIPPVLTGKSIEIARYKLGRNAQEEDVRQRYEDAIRWLEKVAEGKISLGLPAINDPPPVGSPAFRSPGSVFTRPSLADYTNPPQWP